MTRQRRFDTDVERRVRSLVHSLGLRYRKNYSGLPGRPDLANRTGRWAIFVHGCFWHHHVGCSRATVPKRNEEFWRSKFDANAARDARVVAELEAMGFRVFVVWECELVDSEGLRRRIASALVPNLHPSPDTLAK